MKKVYIEPKCRLMALGEEESLLKASEISSGGEGTPNDYAEGREVIRSRSAWDDEW